MFISDILKQFILRDLAPQVSAAELTEEYPLIDNGVIDSMGIMALLVFIEREFRVKVSDEELVPDNFQTLSSLARLISRKTAGRELKAEEAAWSSG